MEPINLIIVILVLIALIFGFKSIMTKPDSDISEQLRALLLARADGNIDEDEFARRQAQLHATLLERKAQANRKPWVLGLVVVIAIAAIGIYTWRSKSPPIGTPHSLEIPATGPLDTQFGASLEPRKPMNVGGDLNVMVKRLADKMAKNPDDGEGWLLLARTYSEINQPKESAAAYAKAAARLPPDATLLADWANVYVLANSGKWDAEAKKIVQRALAADSKHMKALSLAGTEAFDRADYTTAISYWKRMQAASEAGSMEAKLAEANIQEAEALRSGKKSSPLKGSN